MKKTYLLPAAILLLLSGCQSTKNTKVNLSYGSRYDEEGTYISADEVDTKIANEESFLLALSPGVEDKVSCTCWKTFSFYIDKYVKDNDRIIYKTNVYDLSISGITPPESQDPGFAIFKDGKLVKHYKYSVKNPQTFFTNGDALKTFLEDISNAPKMIYINDAQYSELLANNARFAVSFVRKGCGDCKYVLPNVFDPFFKNNETKLNLYLLDIEDLGHYKTSTPEEKEIYQQYKDSLLLSEVNNEIYGYSTGVVPTTFIFENKNVIDGNVFFNDSVAKNEQGQYYISQSYYSEARKNSLHYTDTVLEGKILSEEEVAVYKDYPYLPSSAAKVYHTPIAEAFLNYYFK